MLLRRLNASAYSFDSAASGASGAAVISKRRKGCRHLHPTCAQGLGHGEVLPVHIAQPFQGWLWLSK